MACQYSFVAWGCGFIWALTALSEAATSTASYTSQPDPALLPQFFEAENQQGGHGPSCDDDVSSSMLLQRDAVLGLAQRKVLKEDVHPLSQMLKARTPAPSAPALLEHHQGLARTGHNGAVLTFSASKSAPAIALSAAAATQSAAGTIVFFVFLCVLAAVSVGIYVRSVSSDAPEAMSTASPPPAAHGPKTDDAIGLSSNAMTPVRPRLITRRATVTVSELKHKYWTIDDSNDSMSSFMFVVNMFADLCPPGFLPLAYGMKDTGYIPGLIMLVLFYILCVFTMYAISKAMQITGGKDFARQWTVTVGEGTAWFPVAAVFLVCFGCTLSYSCFFSDIFAGVMPALGLNMSRSLCLLAFTIFPTMPLCLLKNLSALSPSSSFALLAVVYTGIFMIARALDGSYGPGGRYYGDLTASLAPKVPSSHMLGFGLPSLVLLNTLAVAFLSHYNGCKYYRELENHTPTKLVKCTATAMGICTCLFAATAVAAFQTFGTNADAVILKNYSEKDTLANIARLGVGLSLIASFPLMFSGLREATITLLKMAMPARAPDFDLVWMQDVTSMILLAAITVVAFVLTDAGIVVGLVGAICGSVCIYVVPCTLYAGAIKAFMSADKDTGEVLLLRCLTVLGIVLGCAGTYSTLAM